MFERLHLQAAKAFAKKPRPGKAAKPFFSNNKPEAPQKKKFKAAEDVTDEFASSASDSGYSQP